MSDVISINGKEIPKGKKARVDLKIARLPTHTLIDLPVYIYRGEGDGPVLLISAGLHGDEVNGVEAIRRMIADNSIIPVAGTVIAIPIINIYAFLNNTRVLPDGRDLNRSFPGNKDGSLAARIAYILMNDVVPVIDYGVDFHTGALNFNYPQIRCDMGSNLNIELARAFAPPFIINSKLRDGSFRKAALKKGKTILVFEGGESQRFDEFAIQEGIDGVLRLMNHFGMKEEIKPNSGTKVIMKTSWIRAAYSGLFRAYMQNGVKIRKNQIIASITDPFGESEHLIKSRLEGYVIGLRSTPVVSRGDALIHIGMEE